VRLDNEILKRYRKKKKMKQSELAKHLGVAGPQMVSNIERGLSELPLKHLSVYHQVLGIPKPALVAIKRRDYDLRILEALGL